MQPLLTTPFGRRTMSLGMAASQLAARDAPADRTVHKWRLFRTICEARERIGASDRALIVLNALLTFLPETEMAAGEQLIVFPSNALLATRAHGMAPATLRRHLAALVDLGLIVRRDSPNGKRYARKGRGGVIEAAYGFDLSPLVARATEFDRLAEEIAEARQRKHALRERVTIARRNCTKLLQAAAGFCDAPMITVLDERLHALAGAIPRSADAQFLGERATALEALQADISILLESHIKTARPGGSESQTERHIHNSDKETSRSEQAQLSTGTPDSEVSLHDIVEACPDLRDYASEPIRTWADLHDAANLARGALGVSPSLWGAFRHDAGAESASAVIAGILQRREDIVNPSAYLRALHVRLCEGRFQPGPMLRALLRARFTAHQVTAAKDKATLRNGHRIGAELVAAGERNLYHLKTSGHTQSGST